MSKTAFIFPGQGAQIVGMGFDLYNKNDNAKKIYDKANEVLNKDIKKLCFEGPEDALKQTINTQPCLVTTSIAALEALKAKTNIKPDYVAGHSLGEYCALYSAGVMDFEQTLKAIQKRAELMASVQHGTMAAVIKADNNQLEKAIEEGLKEGYIDVANYNSPQQIVLTGDDSAIKKATDYLITCENVRVVQLATSGAFHSKYMQDAGKKFNIYISDFQLNDANIPVITNIDAEETIYANDFKEKIPKQISSSVYWEKTIKKMWQQGIRSFIEIGSGKILTNLNKRMLPPEANLYNVSDNESLEKTINALNN